MAEEPLVYPLVMELMKRTRLPRRWTIVIVSILLLLFLVLMAYLDGIFTELSEWNLWRSYLDGPVLIVYVLVVYPFIWGMWWRSLQVLQSLLPTDEENTNRLTAEFPAQKRRWEWVAILTGAVIWLSLWQPWNWSWEIPWLFAYEIVMQTVLYSLLMWVVYHSFIGSWYLSRLSRQRLNLDIFDTRMLAPVARSGLGFSLAFIGGISLSLVFQTQEDLLRWNNIVVWAILTCFAVLLFFLSMWSTHKVMASIKKRELDLAREHLAVASRELKDQGIQGQVGELERLSYTITSWETYQRLAKEAPTWPFNPDIIRRLIASTLIPVIVYLIKIVSGLGLRFW